MALVKQVFGNESVGMSVTAEPPGAKAVRFIWLGNVDHTRKDGGKTVLRRWRGKCIDCGTDFETRTSALVRPEHTNICAFRCEACRPTLEEVTARWSKAMRDGARAWRKRKRIARTARAVDSN